MLEQIDRILLKEQQSELRANTVRESQEVAPKQDYGGGDSRGDRPTTMIDRRHIRLQR